MAPGQKKLNYIKKPQWINQKISGILRGISFRVSETYDQYLTVHGFTENLTLNGDF